MNTEDGNDIISASGQDYGILLVNISSDDNNLQVAKLNTGEGEDLIIGISSGGGISPGIGI